VFSARSGVIHPESVLAFPRDTDMLKRLAIGPVLVIAALGVIFVGLDILDVVEVYGLSLPVHILNTIFISVVTVPVVYIVVRKSAITAPPQVLWLACGALAFWTGILLYGWLPGDELNARITAHESATLIASALHLTGAIMATARPRPPSSRYWRKPGAILLCYLGVIAGIAVITLLAHRGVIPPFYVPEEDSPLRSAVEITAMAFFLVSSLIYLRMYSKSRTSFHFWYSLGLLLFTQGSVFLFLGSVEGLIAWIGRAAQYIGGIYLLVAALSSYRTPVDKNVATDTLRDI
jgi:hypothetical protein